MSAYTIIGAGPVGTLLALLLGRRGARVRVLERRADPRRSAPERGRSINLALAARGIAALERAGLAGTVAPQMIGMRGRLLHELDGALQPERLRPACDGNGFADVAVQVGNERAGGADHRLVLLRTPW